MAWKVKAERWTPEDGTDKSATITEAPDGRASFAVFVGETLVSSGTVRTWGAARRAVLEAVIAIYQGEKLAAPTTETRLRCVTSSPSSAPKANRALCFAVHPVRGEVAPCRLHKGHEGMHAGRVFGTDEPIEWVGADTCGARIPLILRTYTGKGVAIEGARNVRCST